MNRNPLVGATARASDWRQLLAALPHCRCGNIAEVEIDGHPGCMPCAKTLRGRHRVRTLDHADAVVAIESALSPFEPEGVWSTEDKPCG